MLYSHPICLFDLILKTPTKTNPKTSFCQSESWSDESEDDGFDQSKPLGSDSSERDKNITSSNIYNTKLLNKSIQSKFVTPVRNDSADLTLISEDRYPLLRLCMQRNYLLGDQGEYITKVGD